MYELTSGAAGSPADWAVQSKPPGGAAGYDIVAYSGDRRRAVRAIKAVAAGTPPGPNDGGVGDLPWVSFLGDVEGSPTLSVALRVWSEGQDAAGRTTIPTQLITIAWPASKDECPGFTGLARVSRNIRWTGFAGPPEGVADGVPLRLVVPLLDTELLSGTIDDEIGFDWALAVAAALLDGQRVVITTPGQNVKLADRVRLLDAVCALLPYGCRSWISATTWARSQTDHSVRLCFAQFVRETQLEIPLSEASPTVELSTTAAQAYRKEMVALRAAGFETKAILEHVLGRFEPLALADAAAAVTHLQEMRLVDVVYEEVNAGNGDPNRVGHVLAKVGWVALKKRVRTAFATFLVSAAAGRDARAARARQVLQQTWHPIVGEELGAAVAAELVRSRVQVPTRIIATTAKVSDTARDQLVAGVLKAVAPAPERAVDPGLAARTVVLLTDTKSLDLGNAAAWQVLAEAPALGARLLRRGKPKDEVWLSQRLQSLSPHADRPGADWVRSAMLLFRDSHVQVPPGLWPVPVWWLLLEIAQLRRQFGGFLRAASCIVVANAFTDDATGGFPHLEHLAKLVRAEPLDGMPPPVLAAADLLSLGIGKPMDQLLADRRHRPSPQHPIDSSYVEAMGTLWQDLSPAGRAALASRLPAAVLDKGLTPLAFADLKVVADRLGEEVTPNAMQEVGRRLTSQPDLLPRLALDRAWAEELIQYAPQHEWLRTWFDVHDLAQRPEVDPSELGSHYAQLRAQFAGPNAIAAIGPWLRVRRPVEDIARLLWGMDGPGMTEIVEHVLAIHGSARGGFHDYLAQREESIAQREDLIRRERVFLAALSAAGPFLRPARGPEPWPRSGERRFAGEHPPAEQSTGSWHEWRPWRRSKDGGTA